MNSPTPAEIKAMRDRLNLSVRDAAEIAKVGWRTWYAYEDGTRRMPERTWEYFLIKNGLEL